jgi:hypothetical protein
MNEQVNVTVVEKPFNMRKTRISEFSNAVYNGRVIILLIFLPFINIKKNNN